MIWWITPFGVISSQRRHQRLVAVARDVVVDLFRIDLPGVLQHHVNLLVKVVAQVALQLRNRLPAKTVNDGFGISALTCW